MDKILVIIQARIGSERLPGKILLPFAGKSILQYMIESLERVLTREQIVIATSTMPRDSCVEEFCRVHGVGCYRGDEENVASRFFAILSEKTPRYFIRLCGDSPLIDAQTVRRALETIEESSSDIVTTALNATYPSGMNVECLQSSVFLSHYAKFDAPEHFEHVTKYFYAHSNQFKIRVLESGLAEPRRHKFSVDTREDFEKLERWMCTLERPLFTYTLQEKYDLLERAGVQ